ncbi:MAG: 2-hydroxyacyl-CoA dehydratase family protein, partial [Chloroflexota bacterium]|nr:2-hydroxyacyl-CoA dehydratase family protein [Chloroflexota bacterium]
EELQKFFDVVTDPYKAVKDWKASNPGKKVIGLTPMYLPDEIVHAAGMLPVTLWESNEPITMAHSHTTPFNCALSRSVLDDALKGKLDFLDGMVLYDTCLQIKGIPMVLKRNTRIPNITNIYLSVMVSSWKVGTVKPFNQDNLERMRERLGEIAGKKVSDEALRQSIKLYNRDRALLRQVYDFRRANPGALKAREVVAMVWSSMLMPKEEHVKLLESLVPKLKTRKAQGDKRVSVILAGHLCIAPRLEILDMIENEGANVVDDDIFVGWKYIALDAKETGNPVEALTDRFMQPDPHCPSKVDFEGHWGNNLVAMAKKAKAKGIIQVLVNFCPPHLCIYPDVKRRCADLGVPDALVQTEHEMTNLEPLRTRMAAFVETLR